MNKFFMKVMIFVVTQKKNGDNSMENVGDAILTVRKICESTNKTKLAMLQEGQYF